VLLAVSAVGIVFLLILRPAGAASSSEEGVQTPLPVENGPMYALKRAFALFSTKEMILLSCTFFYTGRFHYIFHFSRFLKCGKYFRCRAVFLQRSLQS